MSWSHAGPGIQRSASHWSASHWSNAWQTWHIRTCKQKLQRLQRRCFEFKFKRGEATIIQLWRHIVPMSQWPSPLSSWWQQAFYGDPPHAALSRSRPGQWTTWKLWCSQTLENTNSKHQTGNIYLRQNQILYWIKTLSEIPISSPVGPPSLMQCHVQSFTHLMTKNDH